MIERYFTNELETVEIDGEEFERYKDAKDFFEWKNVDVCLKDSSGNVIYKQEACEFPDHYSQNACEIIASKYFYRGGNEKSLYEAVDRMAKTWGYALVHEGILTWDEVHVFRDEIAYIIYSQMWAPNSPQWFNTGVVDRYRYSGAKNDEGLFYYDEESGKVKEAEEDSQKIQASACYILDIKDKLIGKSSITDHYVTETKLFKAGSGCGTNFSPLRAEGEALSSGGTSSGLMSYLKGLDVNAGTIKSGGTTRRAAKMVIVDVDHPEIENFIDWKVKEEEKAKALIRAGYDGSIGGEAYSTVSGQNSNNTVRVTDSFMDSLFLENDSFTVTGRVDHSVDKEKSARDVFEKIATAAWECGDPGIQFADRINYWNTCKESGEIKASNPCGEFVFLDNTACNLSSINLEKFITKDEIDLNGLYHVIRLAQLAMEASIYQGEYPTPEIAENSYKFRPTGLGVMGLAGALENLGLSYDSKEARSWAAALCSYITATSYEISSEMASLVGPFSEYRKNRESMSYVLTLHGSYAWTLEDYGNQYLNLLLDRTMSKWSKVIENSLEGEVGFRNAQVTCIAPTGTISLAMDCSSTGVEPYYSRKTIKKLADGSTIEKEIEAIKTADEISPIDHVKMIAEIQPHISGAISKTVNMPNESTVEDVKDVYKYAFTHGCKSITVYRDGSKGTQVLNTKEPDKEDKWKDIQFLAPFENGERRFTSWRQINGGVDRKVDKAVSEAKKLERKKPSGIRPSKTHSAKIGDIQLYITTGFFDDGSLAEIFVNTDRQGEVVNGLLSSLSKVISHLLQYGVEPEKISKILRGQKYEPAGVVERHPNIKLAESISDLISKVIDIESGDYRRVQVKETCKNTETPNNVLEENMSVLEKLSAYDLTGDKDTEKVYGEVCSNCGSDKLFKSGTCKTCINCGTTTGCG